MQVSESVLQSGEAIREAFVRARPFKHAVIENFFEPDSAERLLADFPAFDPTLAKNEIYGGVWGKAVNTRINQISPAYEQLYALIASAEFLDLMSRLSGIPGLLADPALFGGGTHENLHGQDLDPHVDFNYDEPQKLHRRLNLIVFLNKGWKREWGGSLEIHSNPRRPRENQIQSYEPIFNRAVFFETNEYSWHGFPKIDLPESERHRSRKSISIYLYTRERPAEEIAPPHGTFYVHRPLDPRYKAGYTLQESDMKDLLFQVDRRDKWIEKYQQMELDNAHELQRRARYIDELLSKVRAPLTGYALQQGTSKGLYADGWAEGAVGLTIQPLRPATAVCIRGWRPDDAASAQIEVDINGQPAAAQTTAGGLFEVRVPLAQTATGAAFSVEIRSEPTFTPAGDDRVVAFVLTELQVEHA